MSTQSDIKEALTAAAGGAAALAPVLPGPAGIVAGIVAAALGSAASLLDQGQTPEQIVAAMHRARRIDTSVEDAAVDALVAAKPPAQHVVIQPVDPAPLAQAATSLRAYITARRAGDQLASFQLRDLELLVDQHDPKS